MFRASLCPSSGGQTAFSLPIFSVLSKEICIKCCFMEGGVVFYDCCVCVCVCVCVYAFSVFVVRK